MRKWFSSLLFSLALILLAGCSTHQVIVNNVDEREANEIVVFLASKGIDAQKVAAPSTGVGGTAPSNQYSIAVNEDQSIEAMAILNRAGLPRRQGTSLLELFAKSGLMSSSLEETIRYQAGLAEELRNTIQKIDGVIDADVQISFPPTQAGGATPSAAQQKVTAAVYVKHQGILEDPNSHIEVKIKRLMAGSVNGLNYEDVAVISDRSRFTDIVLPIEGEQIGGQAAKTYSSIWGLVMTQDSIARFRMIFFSLIILILLLCLGAGWAIYKFYPELRQLFLKKKESSPIEPSP